MDPNRKSWRRRRVTSPLTQESAIRAELEARVRERTADLERSNEQLQAVLAERQGHVWLLESIDRIDRVMQTTNDLEQMMSDVLDAALSIFDCDRAWLMHPCDPEAVSHEVKMQRTRPEFPSLLGVGDEVPIDPETADMFRTVRASSGPVQFGPHSAHPLSSELAQRRRVQSRIVMALYPKGELPYIFGASQCSYARLWTPREEFLFQEIGRRLEDALTSLSIFHRLRESEKRYRHIFESTGVSIWEEDFSRVKAAIDDLRSSGVRDFRAYFAAHPQFMQDAIAMVKVVDVNAVSVKLFAAESKAELLASLDRILVAETCAVFIEQLVAIAEGRTLFEAETVLQTLKGELLTVLCTITFPTFSAGFDSVLVTVVDITERKRAEQRLMVQHAVTQILAEAATLDEATPRILRAVCEYLVWDLGALWRHDREAGVLRCVEVWHKESIDVPEFEAASSERTFLPGIGLPGRVWFSREPAYIPDVVHDSNFLRAPIAAREALHAAFAFPILLGGEVLAVMEFFSHEIRPPDRDLLNVMATIGTQIGQFIEGKQAENAFHHAQAELAHVTRVATLGEMTASIAHEINQPLAALVTNATACLHWLAAQKLEDARQSVEFVIADGHRAGEIIGRIRALAKKAPARRDWVDVNETIREVIALARSEVHSNGVSLQTRLGDDLPLIVGDRIQLQQVLLNLMINAIEAMHGIGDARRELFISSAKNDSQSVVVAVRDSGAGLNPDSLDRLFHAFYTTKPQGMGMGLAISRSIVETHGGRLWATANVPHGAVFQFTLPIGGEKVA